MRALEWALRRLFPESWARLDAEVARNNALIAEYEAHEAFYTQLAKEIKS